MLIKQALITASSRLQECSKTPLLDARILLGFTLGITHEELISRYDQKLTKKEEALFEGLINRRANYEPIAYITGSQEFYGLEFVVNENVLIPRPETEILVSKLVELAGNDSCKILELGSGSGAISIAIAKTLSRSQITAVDISEKALEISNHNAIKHNVEGQVDFLQSDWYENIVDKDFDFIISNPPYINKDDHGIMSKSTVMHEPELALYANKKGLEHYHTIIKQSKCYLKKNAHILLEIGYDQAKDVTEMLRANNFANCRVVKDYSGLDRIMCAVNA